jgi:class 3 adenylate cyclase/pimeloyl-ACP methyl ester carboxylesterase
VRAADGSTLTYHTLGSGSRSLVFVEPGAQMELLWEYPGFGRFFGRLAAFCRVVTMPARGLYASEGDMRGTFTIGAATDDNLLAVMDDAGVDRTALVGWSSRAPVAVHYAVSHPERVEALVLIDGCAHYVREDDYPWGFPHERLDAIGAFIEAGWGTSGEMAMTAPSADERLRTLWGRSRRIAVSPTLYAEGLRTSLEADVRTLLPLVAAPTLVLHREGDRFIHLGAGRFLAEHIPGAKLVVLPGEDHLYFVGDVDALADEIEEFLTGSRAGAEADVITTNVLFTDIVGSTELQARLGSREWSRRSDEHDAMVRDVLARYRGREVKTTGDGFLATFDATTRALRCALEVLARAKGMGLDLRAGVHTGDVEVRGADIAGLAVSIAKRVCDLAGPGVVLVSETVKTLMTGWNLTFREAGQSELKGVPGRWRLYQLVP